jgi:proton glutamate symport protein
LTANDSEFEKFLQNWLTLKRSDGTYQQLYDYWILGQDEKDQKPRWCILRDVLHWVK